MPTTKFRNAAYRMLLPFFAPSCGKHPEVSRSGHELSAPDTFISLIRRHHVLGSVTLLEHGNNSCLICTSSSEPAHTATPGTYFRVASITKTASAVLLMHLADRGLLDPDDPAGAFFSGKAAETLDGITLRHLLSHTSGLIDPPDLESSVTHCRPFTDLVPDCRRFAPGSSFHYSNLGFGLIGCVLESVLQKPVGRIFQEYLFDPLHMNATLEGCLLPRTNIMPVTRILPYRKGQDLTLTRLGSVPLSSPDPLRHYGHTAGSMYTDASSLLTLLHVLTEKGNDYLSSDAKSDMMREHASYGSLSPSLSYGLGLLRISDRSISPYIIYGHQGFAYGCADGAFWEESTGSVLITLNGGCSEARCGRLGLSNRDFLRWAFREEFPSW